MPALFVGHGSPMNTFEQNQFTRAWRQFRTALPKPKAVLVISAHWYVGVTAVTAMARPRTIHDFHGFPQSLFEFEYPAPGAPDVAVEICELAAPFAMALDQDQWGLDHGAWSVLAHLYPEADIPVVQLSINALEPLAYHIDLGAHLAPLRERGILILASGNVVHNLSAIDWGRPYHGFDWAQRFDDAVLAQLETNPGDILKITGHADYRAAVPTPDHFVPLLYLAGLGLNGARLQPLLRGYAMGSLSMTCYGLDVRI
ncbi:MAG: 4,5-DOPA dioxygenase extradiol [Steroidobacteraceae bacterium]